MIDEASCDRSRLEGPQKGPQSPSCGPCAVPSPTNTHEHERTAPREAQRFRGFSPLFAAVRRTLTNRGAEIRTRDLTDPNGARYQAAPRPDAPVSIPHRYRRDVTAAASDILRELDALLEPERFDDYGPNGLQVPGAADVETVATGVSAHLELFELAAAERAQLLLVHHGIFWGSGPGPIDAPLKRRLRVLFDADIGLAAYHLPLDAHPTLGNNALLARDLGAERIEPFAIHRGQPIGFVAELGGIPAGDLFARVREITAREPLVFDAGPPRVRRVAIVSGAGSDHIVDAAAASADALLTGEPTERVMAQARELGLHFIAAGHYATEKLGVQALGEHLAQRFGVRHVFIDVPNPI
jgi:dinuclear metal center YbgI/SA1388 family protein